MKTGLTLPELATEVSRRNEAKRDYLAKPQVMKFSSNGTSRLHFEERGEHGPFSVNHIAHRQMATRLQIPAQYYDRLQASHPSLLDENVNTLLRARGENERWMVRTLDGAARAFLSDRYRRLDNHELLEAIMPELASHPGLRFASADVTDSRLYIKVTSERLRGEVKKGDVVQVGLILSNSEVGMGAIEVKPFSVRLVCLNGMTHTDYGKRRQHVGRSVWNPNGGDDSQEIYSDETQRADDVAFFLKIRDTVRYCLSNQILNAIVSQMQEAAGIKIEGNPVDSVEVLSQRYRLPDSEKGGILRYLTEGGDLSLWGLANAVTRTAEDSPSYDRASELEELGGNLLSLPKSEIRGLVLPNVSPSIINQIGG